MCITYNIFRADLIEETQYSVKSKYYYLEIWNWCNFLCVDDFYIKNCIHIRKLNTYNSESNGTSPISLYDNLKVFFFFFSNVRFGINNPNIDFLLFYNFLFYILFTFNACRYQLFTFMILRTQLLGNYATMVTIN